MEACQCRVKASILHQEKALLKKKKKAGGGDGYFHYLPGGPNFKSPQVVGDTEGHNLNFCN